MLDGEWSLFSFVKVGRMGGGRGWRRSGEIIGDGMLVRDYL